MARTTKSMRGPAPKWPAYSTEKWEIGRLKAYARNARKHPEKQIDQLRALLRQFGWTMRSWRVDARSGDRGDRLGVVARQRPTIVGLVVKPIGKPNAGNRHVRF